jgi:hypothetical protein
MKQSHFPDDVLRLIEAGLPTLDALEILIFMVSNPGESWTADELVKCVRANEIHEATMRQHLHAFLALGLLGTAPGERYRYSPGTAEIARAVAGLQRAYNEKPVTLIRILYEIGDSKRIRGFADAFRLKKDP